MKVVHTVVALCAATFAGCTRTPSGQSDVDMRSVAELDPSTEHYAFELADYVAHRIDLDDSPESLRRLRALPEHWRYIEPVIFYHTQVENGGHHQYFWNSNGLYREVVAEGLAYFGATEFSVIFQEALRQYRPEMYEEDRGASFDRYQAAYADRPFDDLDSRFFAASPDLSDVVAAFVRSHTDLYKTEPNKAVDPTP